jgi:hypothetical protein
MGSCEKISRRFGRAHSPPCITARRGGRAINKMSRSIRDREAGVVFRLSTQRKTTITASRYRARASRPAASISVASRNLLRDAATPPCGNARRGICRSYTFRYFFTAPTTAGILEQNTRGLDRAYSSQYHTSLCGNWSSLVACCWADAVIGWPARS